MGRLTASLVDRGRVLRQVPAGGTPVEGQRPLAVVSGEWFWCRLAPGDGREREDRAGRRVVVQSAELVVPPDVEIRATDVVEVSAVEATVATDSWRVIAQPRPAATRRKRVAWIVSLERIVEPELVTT